MATGEKKQSDAGFVSRLAGVGEEALTRLMEEFGRNPMLTEALARAMSARGRLDDVSRGALAQVGLASVTEIRDLRDQLERIEKRLEKVERTAAVGAVAGAADAAAQPRTARGGAKRSESTSAAPRTRKTRKENEPIAPPPGLEAGAGAGGSTPGG